MAPQKQFIIIETKNKWISLVKELRFRNSKNNINLEFSHNINLKFQEQY